MSFFSRRERFKSTMPILRKVLMLFLRREKDSKRHAISEKWKKGVPWRNKFQTMMLFVRWEKFQSVFARFQSVMAIRNDWTSTKI